MLMTRKMTRKHRERFYSHCPLQNGQLPLSDFLFSMKSLPGSPVTDAERQSISVLISRILSLVRRGRKTKRMIALVAGSRKCMSGNREAGKMKRCFSISCYFTRTMEKKECEIKNTDQIFLPKATRCCCANHFAFFISCGCGCERKTKRNHTSSQTPVLLRQGKKCSLLLLCCRATKQGRHPRRARRLTISQRTPARHAFFHAWRCPAPL